MPAYNEEKSIALVLSGLVQNNFRCVVVDDGSTDGTSDVARQFPVELLRLPINLGVGGALRLGFGFAVANDYEAAIQFDADGQHDHRDIELLIHEANLTGAELIIGSRFKAGRESYGISRSRRLAMRILAATASSYSGTEITDSTSGFRLVRRPLLIEFANHLPTHYLGDTFEALVLTGKANYRISEVGVTISPREFGTPSTSRFAAVLLIGRALLTVLFNLSRNFSSSSRLPE